MAGLSFRVGETKTTKAVEGEIVVETRPPTAGGPVIDPKLVTLAPGLHHFQLVVEDASGNRSAPATVVITVLG